MRSLTKLSAAALAAFLCGTSLAAPTQPTAAPAQADLVMSTYGPIQGVPSRLPNVTMWLGIPYAKPPVGALRWQAPQAPTPWTQTLLASAYGSPCEQIGSFYGPPPKGKVWGAANLETFGKPVGSEDCLTLNIWRPNGAARDLPVMVYVHGGSGVIGHSSDPIYDAANLAVKAQAVVVVINYRLNIFGDFLHPALTYTDAVSSSGNYSTLDTILSLRFVHDNARSFGGDPGNVTLMGQSAGGAMVYKVMGSKQAGGLFQKAAVLSAGIVPSSTRAQGAEFSEALMAHMVVSDGLAKDTKAAASFIAAKGQAWTRTYLLGKSSADLIDAWRAHKEDLPKMPGNFGDGVVMPVDLPAAYKAGNFIRVPTMVGFTKDEAKLLMTANTRKVDPQQLFALLALPSPAGSEPLKIDDLLKPIFMSSVTTAPYNAYTWVLQKLLLRAVHADETLDTLAKYAPKVYGYRFDWNRGPEPWHTAFGAGHSLDLPFIFGNFTGIIFAKEYTEQNRPGREALSKVMMSAFAAFFHNGDPNAPGLPSKWVPRSADSTDSFVFDATDSSVCDSKGCAE